MIAIEVSQEDIRYVENRLKGMKEKAPGALKNAINRTATKTRKKLLAGANEAYAVQKNKTINSRVKTQRASPTRLAAYIRSTGRPLTIRLFRYQVSKEGVRAEILRGRGLGKPIGPRGRRAFANPTRTSSEEVMQRKGKARKPFNMVRTISVPKMIEKVYEGERGNQGDVSAATQKTLRDEINAEIARLI